VKETTVSLGAVVLAGGRSRRMGSDKAVVEFCGARMIDRVAGILGSVAEPVVVVARRASDVGEVGGVVVEDEQPYAGPLPALVAGLRSTGRERNVVVACDMPFLNTTLLSRLGELLDDSIDTVVPITSEGAQPLHAAYGDCAIEPLLSIIASGERSLKGALERLRVRWVADVEWRPLDPDGRSFLNVNTPEELRAAAALQTAR
jgi:molybdopterin-guanine dinucleotide biosynthesis protein A